MAPHEDNLEHDRIWRELNRHRESMDERLRDHESKDSDQHKKITALETKGEIMGDRVKTLEEIERGRTAKLITVVGLVTTIVMGLIEVVKLFIHK